MKHKILATRWWISHHMYYKFLLWICSMYLASWPAAWCLTKIAHFMNNNNMAVKQTTTSLQRFTLIIGAFLISSYRITEPLPAE
ncbi:MAG TPA: hypothetical protein DCM28_22265, partial [Phycisphaerales bacterium]|nr:hypothetical protein [Phycisphaerales bacterium]HCD33779.1 hypothetical protein [Phycisphaerales bacterium]